MAYAVTENAIAAMVSTRKTGSEADLPKPVVQVTNLQAKGKSYGFDASDGRTKVKAIFSSRLSSEILSGAIQNLALIKVLDYTVNEIPSKSEKYLIITKCEVVSPTLDMEIGAATRSTGYNFVEVKQESPYSISKTKQESIPRSAAQVFHEQQPNMAPAARMAISRRVHPLVSLNPYQGNWTIKVRVTNKANMRTYRNARGEGCVFNAELTDDDGTQIQATMFNEAARKFYDVFQLGKVYYVSKGVLKLANKQFKTVQNDYELTLNENAIVEEASNEAAFVPETKFNIVPIDHLGPYVNSKDLVDVIGVVKSVSPTMSIRRKSDNESIPKRDIVIADDTKKSVVVSLWNELATDVGQELLDNVDKSPIVAIKALKVGDFQGVNLSTVSRSVVQINPDTPESKKLRSWYDCEGKEAPVVSIASGLSPSTKSGTWSMYSDRVTLSHITSDPSLGSEKPVFYSIMAHISYIKPEQTMWYRACNTCSKKVTDAVGGGYWCEGCQKSHPQCNLRYILVIKLTDSSGEGWVSAFNEEAELIIGCSANDLDSLRSNEGGSEYHTKLKEATWTLHVFRVSVTVNEFNNERRQRITVKSVAPVDFSAESRFLLEEISK